MAKTLNVDARDLEYLESMAKEACVACEEESHSDTLSPGGDIGWTVAVKVLELLDGRLDHDWPSRRAQAHATENREAHDKAKGDD